MAFDTAEVVAERLSQTSVDTGPRTRQPYGHLKALPGDRTYDGYGSKRSMKVNSPVTFFDEPEKVNELWRENGKETILKAKNAIFDTQSKLNDTVEPLVEEFVKGRYFVDTKEEALKKVQDNDLGKSASEFLIASEFLHFLKDKKRWDIVGQIERKSSTVKAPEKHETTKTDSMDLKLNRRRIESHLDPSIIKHVDRFAAVFGSGAVTKILVDTKKDAVTAVKLFYNRNDGPNSVFLTTEMIHNSFDGVSYYRDSANSDPTGLSVIDNEGDMLVLNAQTTGNEAKELFSQISIDGKKLSGNFEVVVN